MTKNAFSLVELSIVLVILGLLVGGVLSGQSLIKAAEMRSIITQFSSYRSATYSFRDKYFALPGDMANATAFWGSAGGTGADNTCFNAQTAASKATCNGNGDGFVGASAVYPERFTAWKHLANAGLVEGTYTGVSATGAGGYFAIAGTNMPGTRSGDGHFDITVQTPNGAIWFPATTINVNTITIYGTANSGTSGVLAPTDAWNIDTKFDDGSPVTGAYFATLKSYAGAPNCTTSDTNTATYDFTQTSKNCILVAKL